MDFKFSKDSNDSQPGEAPDEKKKQRSLIALLLILVGGFTYIYFFTGLIKPQVTAKPAATPVAAPPQVVKMPLPARDDEAAKSAGQPAEKTAAPKAVTTAPVVAAVSAAVPVAKPVAAPAKPAAAPVAKATPAPAPAKPKEEPKKVEATVPSAKKSQPAAAVETKGVKPVAAKSDVKKPAAADKKAAPAKEPAKKPETDGQDSAEAVVKTKKTAPESWTVVVGNYVLEETLSADMGHVRKAGFEPVVTASSRKKSAMNRLFFAEFNDRPSALSSLEKLKRHTSDAFVMEQSGKFLVFAGSYLQVEAANSEKDRLKGAGFPVTIRHTDIAIPSQSLSVGPFKSKKDADAALGKLKKTGIKTAVSQKQPS